MRDAFLTQSGSEPVRWTQRRRNSLTSSLSFFDSLSTSSLHRGRRILAATEKVVTLLLYASCSLGAATSLWVLSAQAITYDIQQDWTLYGDLNQNSIPDIGSMACGPTAALNSFVYLQNRYPGIYDHSLVPDLNSTPDIYEDDELITVAEILAYEYMYTDLENGTFADWFLYGKWKYIEDNAPGSTMYAAQNYWTWSNPPVSEPSWVDNVPPTWSFLYDELAASEDVEILINGSSNHFLTLTSFYWDDVDVDGVIDFAEDAWIDYIDPWTGAWGSSDIWHQDYEGINAIATNYGGGVSFVTMVAGESPVPEPTTALLLAAGLVGIAATRRRR